VVVSGGETPAGLAAVRSLDRAGFETWAAMTSRGSRGAWSRAAAGVVDVPDPRIEPDAFTGALAQAARSLGAAAVLPGSEAALIALAKRRNAFPEGLAIGAPPSAIVERATDKNALAQISRTAGMDVPPTHVVTVEGSAGYGDFPAIVKPVRSELAKQGRLRRFDARPVASRSELEHALRALPNGAGIVQPYLEGRLISFNGVAFEGEIHGANQHVVHRVWPDRCGQAVYAETIPMDRRRERAAAAFMRELGWSGVFNIQLIEREGRDHVIDLNPRFYVSLMLATAAGLNLPAIWTLLLLGLPVEASGYRVGVRFREEKGDPRAIFAELRRGRLGAARDILPRRKTVHATFSIRDPVPALSIAGDAVGALRRRIRRRTSGA
jgi:predicted ATP-grasp superfamily ATP-dependent carboligase